jgi:hypothetical protein
MIYTSENPRATAFFRFGLWYRCIPDEEWDCVTPKELASEIRRNEREAVKWGKRSGRLLRKLRGKTPPQTLAGLAECKPEDLAAIEGGRGLDVLAHIDALDMHYRPTSAGPITVLSRGPQDYAAWRRDLAKLFRKGRGDRDVLELEALSQVDRGRITLLEAGDGLRDVGTARDVLQALSIYLDVKPPDGFSSLAEYVWAESTY